MNDHIKDLTLRLNHLCVVLARDNTTGQVTAYTTSEPLFCYSRNSEAEAIALAKDTILDYIKRFYNIECSLDLVSKAPTVPVYQQTPVNSFLPELQYA